MQKNSILTGGIDTLNELKEHILEIEGCREKSYELDIEEDRLEKLVSEKEKSIEEEINRIIKKRKEEIALTYDAQLEKTSSRLKKSKNKRDKQKSAKIFERINNQTADLQEENIHLNIEAKTILKQKHLPKYCNTRLYYMLFSPMGIKDFMGIFLALIVLFLLFPYGIYGLLPNKKILYLVLIYFADVIITVSLYIYIYNATKENNGAAIKSVKEIKKKIILNKKKIKLIKKEIMKDSDDSDYGLEEYDKEIQQLESQMSDIAEQKKNALLTFENTTKNIISDEIRQNHGEELQKIKAEYNKIYEESTRYEDKVKQMSMDIADNYEAYMGKEFMSVEKIDALINIMETENINTISESIKAYEQKKIIN